MTWEAGTTGWDNWLGPSSMCVGKNFTFADALYTVVARSIYCSSRAPSPCPSYLIEPRFSTMCIDLSIHVHVVKD